MMELVYMQHLKCCAARHVGSIPTPPTKKKTGLVPVFLLINL